MATKRQEIIKAIVEVLKDINGTSPYNTSLNGNVVPKLLFWDEVTDYPTVSVVSGTETRDYKSGGLKWGFLDVKITVYVEDEDPKSKIEYIFADIENVLDANNTLNINGTDTCTDLRILSLSDDEGLLAPLGVGEIFLTVQYNV